MNFYMVLGCAISLSVGCAPASSKESYLLITDAVVAECLPSISRLRIKKLQIERAALTHEQLKVIGSFENLEFLLLNQCAIDDDDLAHLAGLRKLQRLDLRSQKITDAGLSHLGQLAALQKIRLRSQQVNGSGFATWGALESLRSLDVNGCGIRDEQMKHVAQFTRLRTLALNRTKVTDVGLRHLSDNYWLLNLIPSEHMTVEGMRDFRQRLLEGRRRARAAGRDVPPDDTLFIQTQLDADVRGRPPGEH